MRRRAHTLRRRYGRALTPRARVEIRVAAGASPVYTSAWTEPEAAERLAARKRDEVRRMGWGHDVRVVPQPRHGHATRNLSSSYGRVYEDDVGTVKQFKDSNLYEDGWYWQSWKEPYWVGPFNSRKRADEDMRAQSI